MTSPLLVVVVPGKPHPLLRARSGQGRHYDPPANVAAKTLIQLYVRWKGPPIADRVLIECTFDYVRPNPTADVDNLAKTVLDAFNGYVLVDDRQVYELRLRKRGGMPVDQTFIAMTIQEDE